MLISKQTIIRAAFTVALILITTLIIIGILSLILPPKHDDKRSDSDNVLQTSENETRAVWISFLEMREILAEKSETEFTNSICEYFENCAESGINTVIFHARSHGDAFYKSALFPTSVYFTGIRQETAPFDPLRIAVREAHARNLKIEAWINPYRGPRIEDGKPLLDSGIFAKWLNTDKVFICENGGITYYYLNPASKEVQNYVLDGVREIVAGYDIDGIHFDDYFYPTTEEWVDAAYYGQSGGALSLADFRRKCVSDFISDVYKTVKSIRDIPFGISPSCNIQNNIDLYYADVKLWGSTAGYVDYLMPQIYRSFDEGTLPFDKALSEWEKIVTNDNVKLMVGLAAYKVGENEYWNSGDILARQVKLSRSSSHYSGYALFRYSLLFSPVCDTERLNLFGAEVQNSADDNNNPAKN